MKKKPSSCLSRGSRRPFKRKWSALVGKMTIGEIDHWTSKTPAWGSNSPRGHVRVLSPQEGDGLLALGLSQTTNSCLPCASEPWKIPGSSAKHRLSEHHSLKHRVLVENTVFSSNPLKCWKIHGKSQCFHQQNTTQPGFCPFVAQVQSFFLGCIREVSTFHWVRSLWSLICSSNAPQVNGFWQKQVKINSLGLGSSVNIRLATYTNSVWYKIFFQNPAGLFTVPVGNIWLQAAILIQIISNLQDHRKVWSQQ